ncbi:hypothetical protein CKF54_00180 [Psittacicella hinzii]|uniref:Uncharacterized protein n=1 Tax=Psittacicella hinzii TaxID=2028575 RepID=A0A3A1Y8E0_9GAMM|nr:hypothetical protein [Psittacicella hinzii]RIY34573.1 hypothetical protein CKF54_00180 [Psittacicella hinzii]
MSNNAMFIFLLLVCIGMLLFLGYRFIKRKPHQDAIRTNVEKKNFQGGAHLKPTVSQNLRTQNLAQTLQNNLEALYAQESNKSASSTSPKVDTTLGQASAQTTANVTGANASFAGQDLKVTGTTASSTNNSTKQPQVELKGNANSAAESYFGKSYTVTGQAKESAIEQTNKTLAEKEFNINKERTIATDNINSVYKIREQRRLARELNPEKELSLTEERNLKDKAKPATNVATNATNTPKTTTVNPSRGATPIKAPEIAKLTELVNKASNASTATPAGAKAQAGTQEQVTNSAHASAQATSATATSKVANNAGNAPKQASTAKTTSQAQATPATNSAPATKSAQANVDVNLLQKLLKELNKVAQTNPALYQQIMALIQNKADKEQAPQKASAQGAQGAQGTQGNQGAQGSTQATVKASAANSATASAASASSATPATKANATASGKEVQASANPVKVNETKAQNIVESAEEVAEAVTGYQQNLAQIARQRAQTKSAQVAPAKVEPYVEKDPVVLKLNSLFEHPEQYIVFKVKHQRSADISASRLNNILRNLDSDFNENIVNYTTFVGDQNRLSYNNVWRPSSSSSQEIVIYYLFNEFGQWIGENQRESYKYLYIYVSRRILSNDEALSILITQLTKICDKLSAYLDLRGTIFKSVQLCAPPASIRRQVNDVLAQGEVVRHSSRFQ